jgi:hypothetical protein
MITSRASKSPDPAPIGRASATAMRTRCPQDLQGIADPAAFSVSLNSAPQAHTVLIIPASLPDWFIGETRFPMRLADDSYNEISGKIKNYRAFGAKSRHLRHDDEIYPFSVICLRQRRQLEGKCSCVF